MTAREAATLLRAQAELWRKPPGKSDMVANIPCKTVYDILTHLAEQIAPQYEAKPVTSGSAIEALPGSVCREARDKEEERALRESIHDGSTEDCPKCRPRSEDEGLKWGEQYWRLFRELKLTDDPHEPRWDDLHISERKAYGGAALRFRAEVLAEAGLTTNTPEDPGHDALRADPARVDDGMVETGMEYTPRVSDAIIGHAKKEACARAALYGKPPRVSDEELGRFVANWLRDELRIKPLGAVISPEHRALGAAIHRKLAGQ